MPAVPGARFAVIEVEVAFPAFEAFLDGPAQSGRAREFGQAGSLWSEDEIVGAFAGGPAMASKQHPTLERLVNRPGQPTARPVGAAPAVHIHRDHVPWPAA